jgi:hypothetical protein
VRAGIAAAVAAVAAAGVGAAAVRGIFLGYPAARIVEKPFLTAKEQAIVAALADAFFPPGGPIPLSGSDAGLVEYMDRYARQLPAGQGRLVRLLIQFLEHAPWAFGPRRQRFSSMPLDARIAVLERMRVSPIYFRRIAFLSMRTMLTMGYLAHPDVASRIGMTPNADPFGMGDRR